MANDARQKLLDVLDREAFDPVLNASPDDYGEDDRERLRQVQDKTESTKRSYHERYDSADKVREMFRDDLSSDSAKGVQKEIEGLGLPTLQDAKDEFERTAEEVGVAG